MLLLIYNTQPEIDLIRLLEIRGHVHDFGESFFSVIQTAVAVVKDTYAVP